MFQAGFDLQAAWYLRGLRQLTGLDDALFRFAVQETYPPYALSVIALGPDALMLAEKKCLYALEVWRASRKSRGTGSGIRGGRATRRCRWRTRPGGSSVSSGDDRRTRSLRRRVPRDRCGKIG